MSVSRLTSTSKWFSVVEVFVICFVILPLSYWAITSLFPALGTWQMQALGFPFPVTKYVLMMILAVVFIVIRGRDFNAYGFTFKNPRNQLITFGVAFVVIMLANIPLIMGMNYLQWDGAVALAATHLLALFVLGWILKRILPEKANLGVMAGAILLLATASPNANKIITAIIIYALFIPIGEELLYRGYVQSRLNQVFGKPFMFFEVTWGWGMIIMAILFALSHVWMFDNPDQLHFAWGFWIFFVSLVYGFLREKTDGLFVPILIHGLPRTIGAFFGL